MTNQANISRKVDWASIAALRAQDRTQSKSERLRNLQCCTLALSKNVSVDMCCAALQRCASEGFLSSTAVFNTALSCLHKAHASSVRGILQMLIAYNVTGSSLFRAVDTVTPDDAPGARYTWDRLDALLYAVSHGGLKPGEPKLAAYMAGAWAHLQREPCSAAIAVLVPLSAALGMCNYDDVITLMRQGSLEIECGYDLMHDMWQAAAPAHTVAEHWIACIVDHLSEPRIGHPEFSSLAKSMLSGLMDAAEPEALARLVVDKKVWILISEIGRFLPRFAAAAARCMAPLLLARDQEMGSTGLYEKYSIVNTAVELQREVTDESVRCGLHTALCLLCGIGACVPARYAYSGPEHATDGIDHVAFCRAWQSRAVAHRYIVQDRVLLGFTDVDFFERVLKRLARKYGLDVATTVERGRHAWARAWAWHRRKHLVLCAARAGSHHGAPKRRAPAQAASHWAHALAFAEQGDIGCDLTKIIASYL